MNRKLFPLIVLPVLLLSSCSCSIFRNTEVKTIDVYNIDVFENSLKDCKTNEIKARFFKNEPYVPYISLKQYASLYDSHFANGVESSVSKKGNIVTWTVIADNTLYFHTQIDFKKLEVVTAGSLESTYKTSDDARDVASLYYGNKTEYQTKLLGNSYYAHYSFADLDINHFSYLGEYYLPLSFYDITYCFDSSLYFYYNYNAIYSSRDIENFYTKDIGTSSRSKCVVSEMLTYKDDDSIPSYLLDLNNNLFFYLLDNFYGLKQYKGIETAVDYCKKIGTYKRLFSGDDTIRTQAYAETLDRLDDNHTALVANSFVWGTTAYDARKFGTNCINRSSLRTSLTNLRAQKTSNSYRSGSEYLISNDRKTAMFLFDEFKFGATQEVFNKDGTINSSARYYDSFYSLLAFFKELKNTGTVENVVIDMSTNGGGVLGVLMKVLALISKNNQGSLYYLEAASQQLGIALTQVDSDDNGLYNADDCYGDDFNLYILTSDCSFSCGNAFPCLAQEIGCAKVIGQKSGGGECAVAVHYLPNGEYVYHSSNLHLGYYDEQNNAFIGFENGAQPDILVNDINDFYSINALSSLIENS